jgi:S-DNA-T family DNA segregation ATPase FtsK/SpoIIIE
VPVGAELRRLGVLGVAGDPEVAQPLARWLVAQLAALHSPRDVKIVLLTRSDAAGQWDWVRWLPHAREDGEYVGAMVGNDQDSMGRRIAELGQLVSQRRAERSGGVGAAGKGLPPGPDVVVVLDGARRLRALPGVVGLLRDGPEVGVHLICLDDDVQALPEECRGVVECGPRRVVLRQELADSVEDIRPDVVELPWVHRLARALSPVRDISPSERTPACRTPPGCSTASSSTRRRPTASSAGGARARRPRWCSAPGTTGCSASTCAATARTRWSPAPPAPASPSSCRPWWRRSPSPTAPTS